MKTRSFSFLVTAFFLTIGSAQFAPAAQIEASSLDRLARELGMRNMAGQTLSPVKIAILDNGFKNAATSLGTLHTGPIAVNANLEEEHGTKMAEIVQGLLKRAGVSADVHLYQAFGYSNFEAAVKAITDEKIGEKFDVVLYSQVWEYGGNGDGKGFINAVVNRALDQGILWINAAGNFAAGTLRAAVAKGADDWVKLPGVNDSAVIRCEPKTGDTCHARLVLSWNSFADDVKAGTDKDLDLVLTDDTLRIVQTAGLAQKLVVAPTDTGASLYPREIIEAKLKPGTYFARVKVRSSNFDANRDELRLTVSGDFVTLQTSSLGESLLAPADNPRVITVGASDSELSSSSRSMKKPDILASSLIKTSDGLQYKGSSNAAAAIAARATLERALDKNLTRDQLLKVLQRASLAHPASYGPTGPGCYQLDVLRSAAPHLRQMALEGGVIVQTTDGQKMFLDEDPFTRAHRLALSIRPWSGRGAGGRLMGNVTGLFEYGASAAPRDAIEFVLTPANAVICPL